MAMILGVRIDSLTPDQLQARLAQIWNTQKLQKIFTPNAEMLLEAHRSAPLRECLNSGELNVPDSFGVIAVNGLMRLVDTKSEQDTLYRVPGVDLLERLCKQAAVDQRRVIFFGGDHGVAQKAANALQAKYPGLLVRGISPGNVGLVHGQWQVDSVALEQARDYAPDLVAVALGHGKQEQFMCSEEFATIGAHVAIGVGGALDYFAGVIPRAPQAMQRIGLEWLYRLYQEPWRWKRVARAVLVFPFVVLFDRIKALW